MLSRRQEAMALGVSERTLRRWRAAGRLPMTALAIECEHCGRAVLVLQAALSRDIVTYEGACWCGMSATEERATGL